MRQLKIGGYKTYDDWGLLLNHKEISPPEIKDFTIEVPGHNGSIDLTNSMGGVRYGNREAKFTLIGIDGTYEDRIAKYQQVVSYLHGQIRYIEEPDRLGEVLMGRWSVSEPHIIEGTIFGFNITCNKVYPYYLSSDEKNSTHDLSGDNTHRVRVKYDGKATIWPLVKFTGNGTINAVGDYTKYNLTSENMKYGHIKLDPGYNDFEISGSGTLTFTYRHEAI